MVDAQNINIVWRYSRAIFDPNQWHEVSEGRTAWLFNTPFAANLHSLDDADSTLQVATPRAQRWQMLPVDGVVGRYVMRSNYTGAARQIGTCYKPDEADDSKTGICLVKATGEDNQKWDVDFVETTGSTYIFRNVANSSDFVLDTHAGSPIYMNKNFDPAKSPAQHWVVRPDGEINDDTFSTTFTSLPAGVTNKPLPTDTGSPSSEAPRGTTRGSGSNPAATSGPSSGSGSDSETAADGSSMSAPQLSAGAAAGIGIGVALGVLLLAAAIFALWRRRQNPHSPMFSRKRAALEMDASSHEHPGTANTQATQTWREAKSPHSENSTVGGTSTIPAPRYHNNASAANNNLNNNPNNNNINNPNNNFNFNDSNDNINHMQYMRQGHGGSPAPVDSPHRAPQGYNATWNDKASPDGYQTWQATGTPISPERRPSTGRGAPVEVPAGIERMELDSTPVDGKHNGFRNGYPRFS